jgi:hypothetical protein
MIIGSCLASAGVQLHLPIAQRSKTRMDYGRQSSSTLASDAAWWRSLCSRSVGGMSRQCELARSRHATDTRGDGLVSLSIIQREVCSVDTSILAR